MFGSWNTFLQQQQTTEKIFKLDHKSESVTARFKFDYPSEIGKNKYISYGIISYKKQPTTPVFGGSNPPYRDQMEFDVLFSIENNWLGMKSQMLNKWVRVFKEDLKIKQSLKPKLRLAL